MSGRRARLLESPPGSPSAATESLRDAGLQPDAPDVVHRSECIVSASAERETLVSLSIDHARLKEPAAARLPRRKPSPTTSASKSSRSTRPSTRSRFRISGSSTTPCGSPTRATRRCSCSAATGSSPTPPATPKKSRARASSASSRCCAPGESFQYTSGCPLKTSTGVMRGTYQMVTEDGDHFDVEIAPFALHEPYTVH